jgi:hypothetical protein
MLQPGIVDIYRQQAISFASNAQWGKAGEAAAAGAAAGVPASQASLSAEDVKSPETQLLNNISQDGVAPLAGPDGQAVIVERPGEVSGWGRCGRTCGRSAAARTSHRSKTLLCKMPCMSLAQIMLRAAV